MRVSNWISPPLLAVPCHPRPGGDMRGSNATSSSAWAHAFVTHRVWCILSTWHVRRVAFIFRPWKHVYSKWIFAVINFVCPSSSTHNNTMMKTQLTDWLTECAGYYKVQGWFWGLGRIIIITIQRDTHKKVDKLNSFCDSCATQNIISIFCREQEDWGGGGGRGRALNKWTKSNSKQGHVTHSHKETPSFRGYPAASRRRVDCVLFAGSGDGFRNFLKGERDGTFLDKLRTGL